MLIICPYCPFETECPSDDPSERPKIVKDGYFSRSSDRKKIPRYLCRGCNRTFSGATYDPCFGQKKRQYNELVRSILCSGVSLRRTALLFHLHRTTVVRKFVFLAEEAEKMLEQMNADRPPAQAVDFDDMVSHEHTKLKPLSITVMTEEGSRWIFGCEVAQMPAKGPLGAKSRAKYGPRKDMRKAARQHFLKSMKPFIATGATIRSDMSPHYGPDVRRIFPDCVHQVFKGKRGCIVGYGELKGGGYDELFAINHACAMIRDNCKRLARRTWCTTKRADRLRAQVILYAVFHNQVLIDKTKKYRPSPPLFSSAG